ncbi:MAG: hypothetical protein MK185_07675 [Saccharospirillaceae bacterium]|nr:hypothetical protein [Saccharospirillaceae bacterium]
MTQRLIITFCIILYALVVPLLEVNTTHVFNPFWPPHTKVHIVWQLITNSAFGILSLWLIWRGNQVILGAIISSLVTSGFLLSFAIKDIYGGSMKYLDGSEKTVFDINIGIVGFGAAVILLLFSIALEIKAND